MPTNARRQHRIGTGGPWGTGLLLLGVAAVAQGVGYATRRPSSLPEALADLAAPIQVWATAWVLAGLWAVWKALTPPQKHTDVWPIVGVTSLWSAAYLVHWLILGIKGDWTQQWTSAVAWGSLATLIICFGRCVNPPRRP